MPRIKCDLVVLDGTYHTVLRIDDEGLREFKSCPLISSESQMLFMGSVDPDLTSIVPLDYSMIRWHW